MNRAWRETIEARFGARESLPKAEMHRRFWPELQESDVLDALTSIEDECDVTIGLLRPDDALIILFEPPRTKNPFRWMEYRVHGGSTDLELSRQLTERLKKHGQLNIWRDHVKTIGDFVRAWCGAIPMEE